MPITAAEFAERARVDYGLPEFRTFGPDIPKTVRDAWNLCIRLGQAQVALRTAAEGITLHVARVVTLDSREGDFTSEHSAYGAGDRAKHFDDPAQQIVLLRRELTKLAEQISAEAAVPAETTAATA